MGDAGTSVERRNEAGARQRATRRAGDFCGAGLSKGSPVVPATRFALLLPATRNSLGAGASIPEDHALEGTRQAIRQIFFLIVQHTENVDPGIGRHVDAELLAKPGAHFAVDGQQREEAMLGGNGS